MISSQRQHLILSRLRTRGAVRITALSKELGVSAMTIRRDIADLADKGLLKRVHGGAVSTSTLLSEPLFSVKSQDGHRSEGRHRREPSNTWPPAT